MLDAKRPRVLVVDDHAMMRSAIQRVLRPRVDVTVAGSVTEALLALADTHFDAVICDLEMPDLGGEALYRAVQADDADLADRILIMTGGATMADHAVFLEEIGSHRLDKPFGSRELFAGLSRVLA